jgi:simple sugar transport system ATP-binding protein
VGSIGDYSLIDNVLMNYYFDGEFSRWGIVDYRKIRRLTERVIAEYGVAAPGPETTAESLSGGNLQKLILARVLSRKPRLIIANLPTQGLDVGATEFVQNKLLEAKRQHAAILLISEDLDEVLSLSDRVAPIYEGEFMGVIPVKDARIEDIGAMMAGFKQKVAEP